jgi:hypothetical protein
MLNIAFDELGQFDETDELDKSQKVLFSTPQTTQSF